MAVNGRGVISFGFPGLPRIKCAFTTRHAGNMSLYRANLGDEDAAATLAARRSFVDSLGVAEWTELKQVHGDGFLINPPATPLDADPSLAADGHATNRKRHALCIKTADCQPILLAHPEGYVGAVHAGWRGNVLHFPRTSVEAFCAAYSLDPADVRAVRGPSLGHAEFVNFAAEWPQEFAPWYDEATRCMDLWSLTRRQLCDAGLKPGNIYGLDLCTLSVNEAFFSHRKGDTGRQVGVIWAE